MIITPGVRQTVLFGGAQLSAAAKTIITAIESRKGSAITSAQRKAIDTFVRAETSAGRWGTALKRFFLPGWENDSANALDWVTATTGGAFVNAVDKGPGWVRGVVATTSYFATNTSAPSLGATNADVHIGYGTLDDVAEQCGVRTVGQSTRFLLLDNGSSFIFACPQTEVEINAASTPSSGHNIGVCSSLTRRDLYRRTSSGFTNPANNTTSATLALTTNAPFFAGAANNAGTPLFSTTCGRNTFFHYGLALTSTQASEFSANCRTLWQTLFSSTLP